MTVTGMFPLPPKHFLCLLLPKFDVSILMHGKGCMWQAWPLKSLLSLDNCLNWTKMRKISSEKRQAVKFWVAGSWTELLRVFLLMRYASWTLGCQIPANSLNFQLNGNLNLLLHIHFEWSLQWNRDVLQLVVFLFNYYI